MNMSGKRVLVAGLGISGKSAAKVLRNSGAIVTTVDQNLAQADLHDFDSIDWNTVDLVVTSPVFNPRTPFILAAEERGIPVMSEVEVAWQLRVNKTKTGHPAPWIGITGTNGKTTTTQMVSAMMEASGFQAPAVGNIGRAVSQAALDPSNDYLCVELSSFQLHFTQSLALETAAITNLAADHLDWHGGFSQYASDKARIFKGVQKALVYNADDRGVSALAEQAEPAPGCTRVGFTLGTPQRGQIGVDQGWIVDKSELTRVQPGKSIRLIQLSELTHLCEPDGTVYPHLLADALCALGLVLGAGADLDLALGAMRLFAPGDHRIKTVARLKLGTKEIRFVDDSKATNAHAAEASLSSYPDRSVVWIGGGLSKGAQFDHLVHTQARKMTAAVIIGQDQGPMLEAFSREAPELPLTVIDPNSQEGIMTRAVQAAGSYAKPGQVVLLAPACASMDQFRSYADRGRQFADQAVEWVKMHEKDH